MAWLKNDLDPSGRTKRGVYQIASGILLAVVWTTVATFGVDRRLPLGAASIGLLLYTVLILLTVRRLRDAGISPGWVVLMICSFGFGPKWHLIPNFYLQVSDLLPLIPVAIGWCAQSVQHDEIVQPT